MKLVQSIDIPEYRIRREFNDEQLQDLAGSILSKGLLHPIVVRNDGCTLLAGERRLRAITLLHDQEKVFHCNGHEVQPGSFPVTLAQELSEDDLIEAELEENAIRQELTWQEETEAVAKLHSLRERQHGVYNPGTRSGWSAKDTATEILGAEAKGSAITKVTEAQLLSEFLDDPLVATAKSKKEALRAIRKAKKQLHRKDKAETFDPKATPHSLIHGDFFNLIKEEAAGQYDVILTDPPYGIDIHKTTGLDGDKHEYDDSESYWKRIIQTLATEGYRVTKDAAHLYMFCDIRQWSAAALEFQLAGWEVWARPLIWYKGNIGSFANIEWGPRSTYESILYAVKSRRPTVKTSHDVLGFNQSTHTDHPAGKPIELYTDLLERSTYPGDKVFDPFVGSGPIFPAAEAMGCIATGYELNEKYYQMAVERLMEVN